MQVSYTNLLYLFLGSLLFFRLPNLYILPYVSSTLFTTQVISRIILISLFLYIIYYFPGKFLKDNNTKVVNMLLLCFLISSSLSILWAYNISSFLSIYKDLLIGIMSFFIFQYFSREKKKIAGILIMAIPINILYQLLLVYISGGIQFLQSIVYQKHFELVLYNLQRGRIHTEVYDEAFLPLVTLFIHKKKKMQLIFISITLLSASYFAFLSNFRTRILMLVFGFFGSCHILYKISIKRIILIVISIALTGGIIIFSFNNFLGFKFYERFLLTDQIEDVVTIFSRYSQIKTALEMGLVSPFGVGLGNYYENLTEKRTNITLIDGERESTAYQYIHNNFATVIAESGYITFMIYCLLIIKFAEIDIQTLKKKDRYKKCFIIAFWLLFFFGLLNPPIPGSYQILFWGIRGLLM